MESPNVIFIVVDTLRKDYAKPLEEELKKFGFISYENAIAPASWTTPSHASIFTGLYPALHGAHETKNKKDIKVKLKINNILSLQLHNLGYKTYLLSSNPYIRPEYGFVGFDYFYDSLYIPSLSLLSTGEKEEIKKLKQKYNPKTKFEFAKVFILDNQYKLLIKVASSYIIAKLYLYASATLKSWPKDKGAKNILKATKKFLTTDSDCTPKFIFINLMEVHEPYFLGDDLGGRGFVENLKTNRLDLSLVKKWRKKYLKEVKYITRRILELINILKEKKVFDNSLIIVTSDHGQLLGEHRRISHGTFLYDELLKVPLLMKYPKDSEIDYVRYDSKYISLVRLKSFILSVIENKLDNDAILYDDIVFAESYGIHQKVGELLKEGEKKNIKQLEKYRIAVYYNNFKSIFNVESWKFEGIISYDSNINITEDTTRRMKKNIIKLLKTTTAVKVPKIKNKKG